MTAEGIIRAFVERGYRLEPDGPEAILIHGRVRPPTELLEQLRLHKLEAIALLTAERTSTSTETIEEHEERLRRGVEARKRLARRLVAIEYDPATRLTTRFYSDGTQETPE